MHAHGWHDPSFPVAHVAEMQALTPACAQVLELLTRGAPERHAEAMRAVPEPDLIAACRGGVKVSVPGLQAAKQAAKASKKKGKG
jgi:hypothetical protein